MKKTGKLCCALLIMSLVVGCSTGQVLTSLGLGAAAGAGVAAVYYAKGDLEADIDHDIERVYKASLSAMEKRGYAVSEKTVAEEAGRIEAAIPAIGADNEHDLTIKLDRKEEKVTHISVRVGVFGNESLSRAILDDIQAKL
jgi:hypothetical protein